MSESNFQSTMVEIEGTEREGKAIVGKGWYLQRGHRTGSS